MSKPIDAAELHALMDHLPADAKPKDLDWGVVPGEFSMSLVSWDEGCEQTIIIPVELAAERYRIAAENWLRNRNCCCGVLIGTRTSVALLWDWEDSNVNARIEGTSGEPDTPLDYDGRRLVWFDSNTSLEEALVTAVLTVVKAEQNGPGPAVGPAVKRPRPSLTTAPDPAPPPPPAPHRRSPPPGSRGG
jgi:hypothetical protein